MNRFSSKILSAALLLLSTPTIALAQYHPIYAPPSACPPQPQLHTGLYIGAQVGYDNYRINNQEELTFPLLDFTIQRSSVRMNANGAEGGIFLGYGDYVNTIFYLGIEGFFNGTRAEGNSFRSMPGQRNNSGDFSYSIEFRSRYIWGLSMLPGFRLSDSTLLYFRVGYNWSSLRTKEIVTIIPIFFPKPDEVTLDKRSAGWRVGVGIETLLCMNLSVRSEFNYTRHNGFSNNYGTEGQFFQLRSTVAPSNTEMNIGLVYHFC